MEEAKDRLQKARLKAGFETPSDAAKAFGWTVSTYISHENGTRGLRTDVATRYAKAFRVKPAYILTGEGSQKAPQSPREARTVPLVGMVGAGAAAEFFPLTGEHDEVSAPAEATDQTVAVEVRGSSLGPALDRWLVYYDDVKRPVTDNQIGQLCVVGLADGRTMVKILQRSKTKGLFHLLPNASDSPPILDVAVDWAARVTLLRPRR